MPCFAGYRVNRAIDLQHYDLVPPVTTFALPAAGTNNTTTGVRTGAGEYVLKRYAVPHPPAGLRYEHPVLIAENPHHVGPARGAQGQAVTHAAQFARKAAGAGDQPVRVSHGSASPAAIASQGNN